MKAIFFATLLLLSGWAYAQYPAFSGGDNDGNSNALLPSSLLFNMYKGGNADGFAYSSTLPPIVYLNLYNGGNADGNAQHYLPPAINFNMFNGGSNDGFAFYNGIAPAPLAFYNGGNNDGFAYHNLAPATTFTMYKGGNADGFAYNKILPATTFAMYKGGNADGFAWDDNTSPPPCNAPVLPINAIGNITASSFTVTWNTVNAGSQYLVKVYLQNDFSAPLFIANGLSGATTNTRTFAGLTSNTSYCVTVQEQCSPTAISQPSNTVCVTTTIDCASPTTLQQLSNSSTSVTLGWTPGAGNTAYEVMLIRNSSTDTFRVSGNITANPQTATLTCLPTGTFFNYFVRESCGPNSWSPWVNGFTTYTSTGCSAPDQQSATIVNTQNANLTFHSYNYYWPKPYQISYGVGISNAAQGTKTAIITPTPGQISGEFITHALYQSGGVGNVTWYVREICNQCDTTNWIGPNTVPATTCTTPLITGMNVTNLTATSATLNFTSVNYNSSALIELQNTTTNAIVSYNVAANVSYNRTQGVTGLTDNQEYRWRVKEYCTTGDSTAYSAYQYFTTPVPAGNCEAPTNLGVLFTSGNYLMARWSSVHYPTTCCSPNGFSFQIAAGDNIGSPAQATITATQQYVFGQSPVYATYPFVNGNHAGFTYFVRDICPGNEYSEWLGPYVVGSSKTDETGIELPLAQNNDENFNWSIYPNPNRGNLLNITTNKGITGEVVIMDITGAVVASYKLNADSNKQLNVDYLSSGIYIVKLLAGEEVYTKKLTISK